MNVNSDIIKKYFDCELVWRKDIPKITFKLKDKYKVGKEPLFRDRNGIDSKKIPYSGVEYEYYLHYFEDINLSKIIHSERKKLASKHSQLIWWISEFDTSNEIVDKIKKYLYTVGKKISNRLNEHYSSEFGDITRKKLKKRSEKWSHVIGKMNSNRWGDKEWREQEMNRRKETGFYEKVAEKNKKRMSDPEYFSKFMKSVNDPERISKISTASKNNWIKLKNSKPKEYYNIVNSGRNRNFELNGYKMNYLEFLIASLLTSMKLTWEYEVDFDFNGRVYIPDFYLRECNTIIECYGDYWHANPSIYESTDTIFGKFPANELWKRDDIRKTSFEQNGYSFLSFWESDIKNNINKIKDTICQNI
jgi:G:T-mismatch repair DNA endonuclease (very short patch repair protein)